MLRCSLAYAAIVICSLAPPHSAAHAQSRAVIELFTSQGCSSCPPADQLLGQLTADPSLVPVSVPVDYWDYLGWKDTLADPRHTARQKAYAHARGDGQVVAATLGPLGVSDTPATLTVKGGKLASAEGGLGPEWIKLLDEHGEAGRNLAELGVGTNDKALLTGSVLEDEKILGTVHVAFGASAGIGGTVTVPIHLDVVVLDPTLDVDGRRVLEGGRYVLDRS